MSSRRTAVLKLPVGSGSTTALPRTVRQLKIPMSALSGAQTVEDATRILGRQCHTVYDLTAALPHARRQFESPMPSRRTAVLKLPVGSYRATHSGVSPLMSLQHCLWLNCSATAYRQANANPHVDGQWCSNCRRCKANSRTSMPHCL